MYICSVAPRTLTPQLRKRARDERKPKKNYKSTEWIQRPAVKKRLAKMALDMGKGTKRTSGFGREVSGENNDHPSMRPQSPEK